MDNGVSIYILNFIDAVWIYMIPIFILYVSRDFISNFIYWFKMKSKSISYFAEGGEIFWNDKVQIIYKIGFTKVVLLYIEDNKKIYTVIHNADYYKSEKKFYGKW